MSGGSINIDDIKGDVSAVSLGGVGNITAKNIVVNGPLTIINNPTKEDLERMRNIQQIPAKASAVKDQLTTQQVEEAKESIDWFKNLLTITDKKAGTVTQKIRAGNLEISRNELLWKEQLLAQDPETFEETVNAIKKKKSEERVKAFLTDGMGSIWASVGSMRLGRKFEESGEYEEAIKEYDKIIEYNRITDLGAVRFPARFTLGSPKASFSRKLDSIPPLVRKGIVLGKLGKHEEAIQYLDKALKIDPSQGDTWYNIGWNLEKLGKHEEAKLHYEKASQIGYKEE